ncbi:MAG: hypothetical protein AAF387_09290 [Pseudomonadota bacterium]
MISTPAYMGTRNPKTIIVMFGIVFLVFMWAKSWMNNLPEPIESQNATATVISLDKRALKSRDRFGNTNSTPFVIADLELADGRTFKSSVFKPYPSVGEKLEIRVTKYSDGSEEAALVKF